MSDIGKLIEEYAEFIPAHIENEPYLSNNGVSRNEREWKAIARAMANDIEHYRKFSDNLWRKTRNNPEMWDTDGICFVIDKLTKHT